MTKLRVVKDEAGERLARAAAEGRQERGAIVIGRKMADDEIVKRAAAKMRERLPYCERAVNALLASKLEATLGHPALATLTPGERRLVLEEVARLRAAGVSRVEGAPRPSPSPDARIWRDALVIAIALAALLAVMIALR